MVSRLTWRNVIPGIIAIAVVLALAASVLVFAGVGRLRGEKLKLYVVTNQARGVMRGTEVWVAGQKVGVVDAVGFRPPTADTIARVVIALSVRKSDAAQIRRDSRAQVRAGANLVGPVVVYINSGTPTASAVRSGDTLRAQAQSDMELAAVKMKSATEDLGPLMADARTVMKSVHDPNGTVGAVLAGGVTRSSEVTQLRARVARLRAMMFGNSGPAARSRARLFARVHSALAQVDSIRALIASPETSFGRFRRDSTLASSIARVRDDLGELSAAMDSANGTVGRLKTDSALAISIQTARAEMSALFADVKRRPLRYINF